VGELFRFQNKREHIDRLIETVLHAAKRKEKSMPLTSVRKCDITRLTFFLEVLRRKSDAEKEHEEETPTRNKNKACFCLRKAIISVMEYAVSHRN
jgi:hypothetical protein